LTCFISIGHLTNILSVKCIHVNVNMFFFWRIHDSAFASLFSLWLESFQVNIFTPLKALCDIIWHVNSEKELFFP
jgi:hypothetical protein